MEKSVGIAIVVILLVVAGFFLFTISNDLGGENNEVDEASEVSEINEEIGGSVIGITSSGFSPLSLDIRRGEVVTFVNSDTVSHWPASDVHPTHRVYPGSSIAKCSTEERDRIFDACKGLARGESWSFRFDEVGTWRYHDHLNQNFRGEIVVRQV